MTSQRSDLRFNRNVFLAALGILWGLFELGLPGALQAQDPAFPIHWQTLDLTDHQVRVIDGDTFDVDLNQNGRLEKKNERVRLLFVDTPELSDSHKGRDRKHGLPARQALEELLGDRVRLWVNPEEPQDRHGRWLGILETMQGNANLALIRDGHSYFDTRFSFPENYEDYARAEIRAFDLSLGIWGDRDSRRSYLLRLRDEGKTVYSRKNPLFFINHMSPDEVDPELHKNRFLRVRGQVQRVQKLRRGAALIFLHHPRSRAGLAVFCYSSLCQLIQAESLKPGQEVVAEGFLQHYQSRQWQIRLHRLVRGEP
jgi:endonuclease YncB( thermonuclease family)